MKKLFIAAAFIAVSTGLFSCKKCTTCSTTSDGTTTSSPEYCDSKKKVEKYESDYMTACKSLQAYDSEIKCVCTAK